MNCCLIRTNTDTATEIRDGQGRNRVTRADGSADCFRIRSKCRQTDTEKRRGQRWSQTTQSPERGLSYSEGRQRGRKKYRCSSADNTSLCIEQIEFKATRSSSGEMGLLDYKNKSAMLLTCKQVKLIKVKHREKLTDTLDCSNINVRNCQHATCWRLVCWLNQHESRFKCRQRKALMRGIKINKHVKSNQ